MEDSKEQAALLADWLEMEGYQVCVTHSVEEALPKLDEAGPFDLVITDIFASVSQSGQIERGLTLIDKIRSSTDITLKRVPIISISGIRLERSYAYRFDDPQSFGSNAHLAKPIDLDRLAKTIKDLTK